jgi:hypothetical protein
MPLRFDALGGIAQLGERLHGMQEVIGSIPFTSTIRFVAESFEKVLKRQNFKFLGRGEV